MPPAPAGYRERPAPPGLAPWVECAWEVEAGPGGGVQRVLPDGCMDIVFVDGRGLEAVGANLTAFLAALPPGGGAVGVRMRPGGAPPLLGVSGEALRDARPPAADVLGDDARRLEERVAAATTAHERAGALLGWIADRARRAERPDPVVARVARRLGDDPRAAVADLADETGIGTRQLRRRVVREVGYGPRRLARVLRLQRTVALAAAEPGAGLSELAFRAGYSDQSHLSHECRELAGLPPSQLLVRERAEGRFVHDTRGAPRETPLVNRREGVMAERARLGWVIVYVPAVEDAIAFYERAFGLERTFIDPSGTFGQLATGDTALAFAHESLAVGNFPGGVRHGDPDAQPSNVELALVFDDPLTAFRVALEAGCTALAPPEEKPHGQVVGWVRDPWGTLIEVCSPVG